MIDPIIDRSPQQKRLRMEALRAELAVLGYSIVETEWLRATLFETRQRLARDARKSWKRIERSEQAAG